MKKTQNHKVPVMLRVVAASMRVVDSATTLRYAQNDEVVQVGVVQRKLGLATQPTVLHERIAIRLIAE
jgi:hypothetical protein